MFSGKIIRKSCALLGACIWLLVTGCSAPASNGKTDGTSTPETLPGDVVSELPQTPDVATDQGSDVAEPDDTETVNDASPDVSSSDVSQQDTIPDPGPASDEGMDTITADNATNPDTDDVSPSVDIGADAVFDDSSETDSSDQGAVGDVVIPPDPETPDASMPEDMGSDGGGNQAATPMWKLENKMVFYLSSAWGACGPSGPIQDNMALVLGMSVTQDDTIALHQINPAVPEPSLIYDVTWTDLGFDLELSLASTKAIDGQPGISPNGSFTITREFDLSVVGSNIAGSGSLRVMFKTENDEVLFDCTEGLNVNGTCYDLLAAP